MDSEYRSLIDLQDLDNAIQRFDQPEYAPGDQAKIDIIVAATDDVEAQCSRKFLPVASDRLYAAPLGATLEIYELDPLTEIVITAYGSPLVADDDYELRLNREGTAYSRVIRLSGGLPRSWRLGHETEYAHGDKIHVVGVEQYTPVPPPLAKQEVLIRSVQLWLDRQHLYAEGSGGPNVSTVVGPPLMADQIRRLKRITRSPLAQVASIY